MIRFATPTIAEDIRDDGKVPQFDRSRHGMIGPAAGLVVYDRAEIEARLKAISETASTK